MSNAQCVGGVWLPASERHLVEWMRHGRHAQRREGYATYQIHKLDLAIRHVPPVRRRVAVDVGAHCGLWSMWLTRLFRQVVAFEPVALHADLFARNVAGNYTLHRVALGERAGRVRLRTDPASTGNSYVAGDGDVPMHRLDDYRLDEVDLIKIDVEGHELPVVRGARETLLRCRPTVIVEQKGFDTARAAHERRPGHRPALDALTTLGFAVRAHQSGDYVLTFGEPHPSTGSG